jgi:hypothetical protein
VNYEGEDSSGKNRKSLSYVKGRSQPPQVGGAKFKKKKKKSFAGAKIKKKKITKFEVNFNFLNFLNFLFGRTLGLGGASATYV